MKKLVIILLIISVLSVICYNWIWKDKNYKLVRTGESFTVELNLPSLGLFYPIISTYNQNDSAFCYYFSNTDTTVQLININKNNKRKVIALTNLIKDRIQYQKKMGLYLFLETPSLGWIDSGASDSLYQINFNNTTILKAIRKKIVNYMLYDFMNRIYINSEKNELLLGIFGETNATYGLFEIRGDSLALKKELGIQPDDYKKKDMYINAGMLTRLAEDSIIISYYYSDSVDLYIKNNFNKRICLKSDSSIAFTGFVGDRSDINAIKKFFSMNQRYNQLFYDSKNKLYYRVFSFEKKSIGKIEYSKKWSICIFDNSFTKIHEEIFNNDEYYKGYVLLINSNLYIANVTKSTFKGIKDSSTIVFDRFKLKSIEN